MLMPSSLAISDKHFPVTCKGRAIRHLGGDRRGLAPVGPVIRRMAHRLGKLESHFFC